MQYNKEINPEVFQDPELEDFWSLRALVNQKKYKDFAAEACELLAEKLSTSLLTGEATKPGFLKTFLEEELAPTRKEMSKNLGQDPYYGTLDLSSDFSGGVEIDRFIRRFESQVPAAIAHFDKLWHSDDQSLQKEEDNSKRLSQKITFPDGRYVVKKQNVRGDFSIYAEGLPGKRTEYLPEVEKAFINLLEAQDETQVREAAKELLFHMAILKPFVRGSASSALLLTNALLLAKDVEPELIPKTGLSWDVRAFMTADAKTFVKDYSETLVNQLEEKSWRR